MTLTVSSRRTLVAVQASLHVCTFMEFRENIRPSHLWSQRTERNSLTITQGQQHLEQGQSFWGGEVRVEWAGGSQRAEGSGLCPKSRASRCLRTIIVNQRAGPSVVSQQRAIPSGIFRFLCYQGLLQGLCLLHRAVITD